MKREQGWKNAREQGAKGENVNSIIIVIEYLNSILYLQEWFPCTRELHIPLQLSGTHKHDKFPLLSNMWESSVKNLFFIGTSMQSIDREAASGFIHGFRYNIRTLCNLLQERYLKVPLPRVTLEPDLEQMVQFILGLYVFIKTN